MALFKTRSAAIYGVDARLIDVEVDIYMGSPKDFITVGLPDTAVRELPAPTSPAAAWRLVEVKGSSLRRTGSREPREDHRCLGFRTRRSP